MQASTPIGLMEQVCEAITKDSPFRFAWVGVAEQDAEQSVSVLASAGPAESYLRSLQLSWSEKKAIGTGPAGTALRNGETVIVNDCGTDERCAPFRERVKAANIHSLVSVPFQMETRPAVLCVYSPDPHAFGPVVVEAFQDLAREIGVGVNTLAERERLNMERQQREAAQQDLAAALDAVIGAISTAMEARDSYTAGHQRRVADITTAIAKEMGWPHDRIEALRVAALVHDIGKIAIPSEVLARPTCLSETEWLLIKEHPEKGYQILKEIPFGWPIAETVRQHQERMDGSGYPRGLIGDEIILGARIVAVADVVEAMASRRPYRAALGIEKALSEIEIEAGTKLDADVVRICISLFREKGFALPETTSQG
jgi:putative nucleotidyltransferase with HDIG domain